MEKSSVGEIQDEIQEAFQMVPWTKRPFVSPKLMFLEPELVKQGKLERLTGYFGTFSP